MSYVKHKLQPITPLHARTTNTPYVKQDTVANPR